MLADFTMAIAAQRDRHRRRGGHVGPSGRGARAVPVLVIACRSRRLGGGVGGGAGLLVPGGQRGDHVGAGQVMADRPVMGSVTVTGLRVDVAGVGDQVAVGDQGARGGEAGEVGRSCTS